MPSQKEVFDYLSQLLQLTQDNQLLWNQDDPPQDFSRDINGRVLSAYTTNHLDKRLLIYKLRCLVWMDEETSSPDYKVVVAFINSEWDVEWEFPEVPGLDQLFSAVQFQAAGLSDHFKRALTKAKKP